MCKDMSGRFQHPLLTVLGSVTGLIEGIKKRPRRLLQTSRAVYRANNFSLNFAGSALTLTRLRGDNIMDSMHRHHIIQTAPILQYADSAMPVLAARGTKNTQHSLGDGLSIRPFLPDTVENGGFLLPVCNMNLASCHAGDLAFCPPVPIIPARVGRISLAMEPWRDQPPS